MPIDWNFDNTYARDLAGFYVPWQAAVAPDPGLVALNDELAHDLGLDAAWLRTDDGIAVLAGNSVPDGATPIAQAYSGHQFGHFQPMLGDGRALLLGEVVDQAGRRRDIAFKGSGRTQFSRGGDGKAVLGPVLREFLVGEAMHALGIPTTRALAAVTTGQQVMRERGPEPGAILTRVAASHLRVGTMQMAAHHGGVEHIKQLADYAMARHYPELPTGDYFAFLSAIVERQADLIAAWMSVGFIHGVMNTDNMTLSGETIDYGPCAFMEGYDEQQKFSSIDTGGRYRYGQQPPIAIWNLSRLAETLAPVILADRGDAEGVADEVIAELTERVTAFRDHFTAAHLRYFRAKLGISASTEYDESDREVITGLLAIMQANRLDFTLTFRRLAAVLRGEREALREQVPDLAAYDAWERTWLDRVGENADRASIADAMDSVNPLYIPRNHLVEQALSAANDGDVTLFERLLEAVRAPYAARDEWADLAEPAPLDFTGGYVTYCGT